MVRSRRSWGTATAIPASTTSVPMPPLTTLATGPKSRATAPLSKPPSSFEHSMNMVLTAPTRPRRRSGVRIWTRTWRITTLMLSAAPATASANTASQGTVEKPKTMVATAKTATLPSSAWPALRKFGRNASHPAMISAPTYGAARSTP